MKAHVLFSALALTVPLVSFAQTNVQNEALQPLRNVKVSMQRMLKSTDGRYFLDLYAGIPVPHAHLTDTQQERKIDFKGVQKSTLLTLHSYAVNDKPVASTDYSLEGNLNIISSQFNAQLNSKDNQTKIQFGPAFKAVDKPALQFDFYGDQHAIKRVDVVNKVDHKVIQTLTGFTAYPNTIGYLDINFDGYYDVVLSNIDGYSLEDKRYIYWMYNPKTRQFQRSKQLENIVGFPRLNAEKQQVDFGNGQVFQLENGQFYRLQK